MGEQEAATTDVLLEERSGRSSSGGGTPSTTSTNNVSVVVTNCTGGTGVASNPVKPEVIFQGGSTSPASTVETPPPPAKTYREEIVIKNSDSGKGMIELTTFKLELRAFSLDKPRNCDKSSKCKLVVGN